MHRFTLLNPIINCEDEPVLVIRKFPKRPYTTEELIGLGVMTPEIADYLSNAWNKGSLIVCGAPSAGKSTVLNWLKEFIPQNDKATLIVQETDELTKYKNRNTIYLHSIVGNSESEVSYGLDDLTIAGLTLDVGYCIISEIKGKEARYLTNASFTGLVCGGTIHSNSADHALDKIVDYALMGNNVEYTKTEILEMLDSFKTIIFMKDFKVAEIDEVVGFDENTGKIDYKPVYRLNV